ncbi:MAG: molybdopterin molybdotransferase MoeA [Candidatus Omnitrophica bacterium]|nr:molybdopterin molybdotransferase MoeA [Candidatus Omnitrophota bacterium]
MNIKKFQPVRIPLQDAYGMVLQEDLIADRDLPPFDRVTMDGISIRYDAWEKGNRAFSVKGTQKAGTSPLKLKDPNTCLEVMTGAVLPDGCDCVVPYEDIELDNGRADLRKGVILNRRQFVHHQASDCPRGTLLVEKGDRLLAAEVAIAASIGKTEVLVAASPKIAAVGTGDEVVDVQKGVGPQQIRQSNAFAIQAALKLAGYDHVDRFHIRDHKDEIRKQLTKLLEAFDVIVLSGGVSMGEFDYVPEALADIGVQRLFHQVKQRPGKPFWFGKSVEGKPVFGLPGNPVSTQVGICRYVLPYLERASGAHEREKEFAVLDKDVDVKTDRVYFLPVKIISGEDARLIAVPQMPHNSGDYAVLAKTDGFVELPADTSRFAKGTAARLFRWKT